MRTHCGTTRRRSFESDLRAVRRKLTKLVIVQKNKLREKIKADTYLKGDFEFFVRKTGWNKDKLLQGLYWDSNMMHADSQSVISKQKAVIWPIQRNTLETILEHISLLAEQTEKVNATKFSPARTVILRDSKGIRLHSRDEQYLLKTFSRLPDVLRFYHGELKRRLTIAAVLWSGYERRWQYLVQEARRNSLYEQIRLGTPDNKYHAVRLHRLVNAAREVQGLAKVEYRAFLVWLNRLKKRTSNRVPTARPSQDKQE